MVRAEFLDGRFDVRLLAAEDSGRIDNLGDGIKRYRISAQADVAGNASIPVRPITARTRLNIDRMATLQHTPRLYRDEQSSQNAAAPPRQV